MFHINEVAGFIIMIGVLLFMLANLPRLRLLPHAPLLLTAFVLFFFASFFSLLEFLRVFYSFVELVEQASFTAGNLLVAAWCWRAVMGKKNLA